MGVWSLEIPTTARLSQKDIVSECSIKLLSPIFLAQPHTSTYLASLTAMLAHMRRDIRSAVEFQLAPLVTMCIVCTEYGIRDVHTASHQV